MRINEAFNEIIGQKSTLSTLSVYIEAFKETGRLRPINFLGAKGNGKTYLAKAFRAALRRPDGSRVPMLEINGASVKNLTQFLEQIYPVWTAHKSILFVDEFHAIPKDLQTVLLSVLNVEKSPHRQISHNGQDYAFNFNEIGFLAATTDAQKLCEPLRDRLRAIALEEYKPEELYEIFENNLENRVSIDADVKEQILSVFRGNPRDAVVKAEDLKTYISAQSSKNICAVGWQEFCKVMGIGKLGLNSSEIQIIKALGKNGDCSLNYLASVTGFERSAIQNDYEKILFRKGLLTINGKRSLSANGIRFYHAHCK